MSTKKTEDEGDDWKGFVKTALMGTIQTLAEQTFRNVASTVESFTANVSQTVTQKIEETTKGVMQRVGAGALALVGAGLFLGGFAELLSDMWRRPGSGEMAVGGVALAVAIGLFIFWSKK